MLVLTGMDYNKETLYDQVKKSLNKFKGEQATGGCRDESSAAAAKLELTLLAENKEILWVAGYTRCGRINYGSG